VPAWLLVPQPLGVFRQLGLFRGDLLRDAIFTDGGLVQSIARWRGLELGGFTAQTRFFPAARSEATHQRPQPIRVRRARRQHLAAQGRDFRSAATAPHTAESAARRR